MSDADQVVQNLRKVGGVVLNNVVVNLREHHPEIPPEQIPAVLMIAALNMIMHIYHLQKDLGEQVAFSFIVSMLTTLKINGIDLKIEVPDLSPEQKLNVGLALSEKEGQA